MSVFRGFLTNISWNVIGKICVQALLLVVSILITRYLGKDRLGLYASILVIPAFIRLLNGFGLETLVNKKLAELQVRDPSLGQGRYALRRLLALRLTTSLVLCLLLYLLLPAYFTLIHMPELADYRLAILAYFLAITINSLLSTLFMTYLKYKVTSVVEIVSVMCNVVFLAAFISLDWGIKGVLFAYVLSTAATIGIYSYLSLPYIVGESKAVAWGDSFRLAWVSYVTGIFSFGLMTQSDVVLMNYFGVEPARVGYYHLGMGVSGMLTFVFTGIGPLALSIFSETFARESHMGLARSWRQIAGFNFFFTAPVYVFAFFNSAQLIAFIYGSQFVPAGGVMTFYLVFSLVNMVLGGGFLTSMLYVVQRSDIVLRISIEGSILNIFLDLVLIPYFNEMGAVAATGSAMVYMSARQWYALNATVDVQGSLPFIGRCFFFSLVAATPFLLLSAMGWDHLVLSFAVYALSLVLVLGWVKPLSEEHRTILSGIQPRLGDWARWFVRG